MKEVLKLVLVLTAICVIAGLCLALVDKLTTEPIRKAERQDTLDAIKAVLPEYDNEPDRNISEIVVGKQTNVFYVATMRQAYVGTAFAVTSKEGYGGEMKIMVGVTADDGVHAIHVLKQTETPGLGAKIEKPKFKEKFSGAPLSTTIKVKKDGGRIESITGATISSRAVCKAVSEGIDLFVKNKDAILKSDNVQ